jgi:cobalamin biosynthesis protein CobT
MKKIKSLLILLMLMISISSLVLADEAGEDNEEDQDHENETQEQDNETEEPQENETEGPEENETNDDLDNETAKEIEIMNNSLGAEIRLLQLEKAIIKNVLKGEMAVEVLKGLDFNTTALETILDEMKVLLEEVKAANASANDSVIIFVELKKDAKNYTKQFRETMHDLLNETKINEIKALIKEMVSDELQNYSKRIQHIIRQFNRNQLYRLYGIIGETNNSFVNEYLNGNVTLDQVKLQICKTINQMTKENRYDVFSEIKEDHIKNKIHSKASAEDKHNNGKGKGNGKPK